jgi:transcription-repair coupling factor (superfamily II helicase)
MWKRKFEEEEKVSLLQFLPENTVIWIQDEELTREKPADGRRRPGHVFATAFRKQKKEDEGDESWKKRM